MRKFIIAVSMISALALVVTAEGAIGKCRLRDRAHASAGSHGSHGGATSTRARVRFASAPAENWWPWDEEDDVPQPSPDEPAPAPQPDPAPLPDEPDDVPTPEPSPPVSPLPDDPAELNVFVGKLIGGYVRANHERNGVKIDVYQARGPHKRVVWEVANCEDWMSAVGKASYLKKKAGSSGAGLILICDQPTPKPDPAPEPEPEPLPEPTPGPDVPSPDDEPLPTPEPEGDEEEVIYACGGENLLDAQDACEGAGLQLVIVYEDTGTANRVIYDPPAKR